MRCLLRGGVVALAVLLCFQGLLATVFVGASPPMAAAADAQPNVVVILADDLDYRALMDNIHEFPNIATLLESGTSFDAFFVTTPLCCPSRASILRGQYAHNHGVLQNGGKNGGFRRFYRLDREESTVATWLHDAGYRTGFYGKYLNGYPQPAPPGHVPPGWDDWHALEYKSDAEQQSFYLDYQLVENGQVVPYPPDDASYSTDVLAARAVDFVREAAPAGPFFALVAPYAPHSPAIPAARHASALADLEMPKAPSFAESDVRDKPTFVQDAKDLAPEQFEELVGLYRDRLRSMLAVDDMVGQLVTTLDEAGVLDNTYVIFTSDNGLLLGEHRLWHGKQVPYEESIHVPTIVRGPQVPMGETIGALALNIDLAPTIADWAGAEIPEFVDGRSFAPLLRGDEPEEWRQSALIENFRVLSQNIRREVEPLRGSPRVPPYSAVRAETFLYVEYDDGVRELYDLARDPFQLENLIAAAPDTLIAELSDHLARLRECAGEACRAAENLPLDEIVAELSGVEPS